MKRLLLRLLLLAIMSLAGISTSRAQNICIEYGPFYGDWECLLSGSVSNSGSLTFTNATLCVGDLITASTLATFPIFADGKMRRFVTNDCPEHPNYWQTNAVRYIPGPLYFSPALPSLITNSGVATYVAQVEGRPTSLVGWWPAEANPYDIVAGNNGTLVNGATFAAGQVGQAFSFDGVNDYITNATPGLYDVDGTFTIEFWAWPTGGRNSTTESLTHNTGSVGQRYAIFPNKGGLDSAGVGVSVGTNGISVFEFGHISSPFLIPHYFPSSLVFSTTLTNWTHIAVVYENQQPKLFINGNWVRTGLRSSRSQYPSTCLGEAGLGYGYYKGLLDEVSIYSCALTTNDIQAIYAAGSAGKCWTNSSAGCATLPPHCACPSNITATVGSFTITAGADSDYDGICDCQEALDGTSPSNPYDVTPLMLGSWRFDNTNWNGLQAQTPLLATNLAMVLGLSQKAVSVSSNLPAWLMYRDVEDCFGNINCREGSLRFWFKSGWNSSTTNNGTGPQSEARLIELGQKGSANGYWGLLVSSNGTNIYFCSQTNASGTLATNLSATICWTTNAWHQIVLTYSPTNSALYLDGQAVTTTGGGVSNYPSALTRAQGFRIGSDFGGTNQARGRFENLETYNYVLSGSEITNGFATPCWAAADIAMIIDRSSTMVDASSYLADGTQRLRAAKIASTNFVQRLNFTNDQAALFSFAGTISTNQLLTNSLSVLLTKIDSIVYNDGYTVLPPALQAAQAELKSLRRNWDALPVIVLLSDGLPDDEPASSNMATQIKIEGTRIVTVSLGSTNGTNFMRYAASSTNDYYYANSTNELNAAYDAIATKLCRSTNVPPTVSIFNPTNGQSFTGPTNLLISASAADNENGLVKVEFYAGNFKIGEDYHAPFTIHWTAPLGTTNLTARALDEQGLSTTSSVVSITVTAAAPPLTVQFITPTNNQLFVFSPTNILVRATNTVGTITKMEFYNGGTKLGETNAPPYQLLWTNVTGGTYTIKAVGTNSTSGVSATNTVDIIVNAIPVITNNAPTNVQAFTNVVNVGLTNTAWDPDAYPDGYITNVVFYTWSNSVVVPLPGTALSNNLKYSLTWSNRTAGYHSYYAVATDNLGAASTSPIGVFKVNPTNTPPTVWITYPTNSEVFRAGADITITADVFPGSGNVTNVEFFVNNRLLGSDPEAPYSITVCCWQPGAYTNIVKATDDKGMVAISTNVQFSVRSKEPALADGYWEPRFRQFSRDLFYSDPGYPHFHDFSRTIDSISIGPDGMAYMVRSSAAGNYWPFAVQVEGTNYSAYMMGTDNYEKIGDGVWTAIKVIGTNIYAAVTLGFASTNQVYKWSSVDGDPPTGTPSLPVKGHWVKIGSHFDQAILAVEELNGELFVGGDFTAVFDGTDWDTNIQFVAKFNATNDNWEQACSDQLDGKVYSLVAMGGKLYAGGCFASAGDSTNLNAVAYLDGGHWNSLSNGLKGDLDWEVYTYSKGLQTNRAVIRSMSACGNNLFIGGHFKGTHDGLEANGVAIWNAHFGWSTPGGVNSQEDVRDVRDLGIVLYGDSVPTVLAVKAHGDDLFVTGNFTNIVQDGVNILEAHHIAQATYNEDLQRWVWKALDMGAGNTFDPWLAEAWWPQVFALDVRNGANPGEKDVFCGGNFIWVGENPLTEARHFALWRGGYSPPSQPFVTITNPVVLAVLTNESAFSIPIVAMAGTNIDYVEFFVDDISIGNGVLDNHVYVNQWPTETWSSPTNGVHVLKATATDLEGVRAASKPVLINIKGTNQFAFDDAFGLPQDSPAVSLHVTTNDALGVRISRVEQLSKNLGHATIGHDGTYISYIPFPNMHGTDRFIYTVTNVAGLADSAWVMVNLRATPTAQITTPFDGQRFKTNISIAITNTSRDWDGAVTNVALWVNGWFYKNLATNLAAAWSYTTNWTTNAIGFYTLETVATDNEGFTNFSAPVTVVLTNTDGSALPTAHIANLVAISTSHSSLQAIQLPTIRDGVFDLVGTASGDAPVSYQVLLYRPDDWEAIDELSNLIGIIDPFADITPTASNNYQGFVTNQVIDSSLGELILTEVPNGVYDLVLRVRGGSEEAYAIVRVMIESNLKIGQFSFSEQDIVLPVNGIPLTVTRTYNSLNPRSAEFGPSWSYALNSMDVEIDEDRVMVTAVDTLEDADLPAVNPMNFSVRVGGGRNVTLTLPDGRRTTFQFTYAKTTSGEDCPSCYDGEWIAPPGVTAKLTTPNPATKHSIGDDTVVALFSPLQPYWQAVGPFTPLEAYDIPEFILTTDDSTEYHITRDAEGEEQPTYIYYDDAELFVDNPNTYYIKPHPGKPKLTKIVQRSGDYIKISDTGISHYNATNGLTRCVYIERGDGGRIVAIRDPNSGSNGLPVMKYVYNRDTGNLIQVHRLQDRAVGTYTITKYHYDHAKFPHYITSMEDPRGIPVARNEYSDDGRLTAVVDADGKRTQFIHNTTNKVEIITDRLGNTNSFAYDLRGNVTATTNALNQVMTMAYDEFDNKTNDVVFLNDQPYATNSYIVSTNGAMLASINALGHSNTFVYGQHWRLEISTDARGFSTTNYYDHDTDNLIATSDALGNITSNYFSTSGLLVGTRDALGTVTTNFYDNLGSLTASATLDASGKILTTNSFAYDANGNQTNSITWRTNSLSTGWLGATNTTIYDAQNRVVQTIAPNGGVNTTVYNAIGKQAYSVNALNRTNHFEYDTQGRMWRSTYEDFPPEISYFDAAGRRTNSVDLAQHSTTNLYDALGRMTKTIYADSATTRTVYDDVGRIQFSIDSRDVTNAFGYDLLGRRIAVTNAWGVPGGMTNFFGYDANGNQPYVTNALGFITTNVFDALNRVTQVKFANGTQTSTAYDAVGRRIGETNQANVVTRFGYDGAGRLLAVTNAFGKPEQTWALYIYDEAGSQTAQIDALNRTNRYAYDGMGRRISHTMPDPNLVETFGYDLLGNMIRHTNFNGVVLTNHYDVMNRLTNRSSINGYSNFYAYTVTGQRTLMVDVSGTTTYAYDVRNRLTNCGSLAGQLSYLYDANGNLTNLWSGTANGVTNFYQYDALNRLTNVLDGRLTGNKSTAYGFDAVGNLQRLNYPNGVTNLYQYDVLNRLTNLNWKHVGNPRADFAYKLGLTGNRTNLAETINGVTRSFAWQYDSLHRLTNELVAGASSGSLDYEFDRVGNRTNRSLTGTLGTLGNQAPTFNTNDWLKTDAYDPNGNTLWSTNVTATGPYYYDVENRLTNLGNVTITYNGDGQRVKKVVSGVPTLYLVDGLNPSGYAQVLEELTAGVGTNYYTYGLDLISQRRAAGVNSTNFFGYDGHGSTRFLVDGGGTVANVFAYEAYGTLIASDTTAQTAYLYCGEQFDADLGFYYLRARYLNPNTGRFWTGDSYEGNNEDPLSLHKYLYCQGNPANLIDPTGHWSLRAAGYGNRVQEEIEAHFKFWSIDPVLDKSVNQVLKLPVNFPVFGALRPDLVERGTIPCQVYEIKPVGSFIEGRVKLQLYLTALNRLDLAKRNWIAGQAYLPPTVVPVTSTAIAIVSPPVNGVILYEVIDMKAIIAAVAVAVYVEMKEAMGAIGLRTATMGL